MTFGQSLVKGITKMASIEKRGDVWRVRIVRKGHPAVTRSFPTRRDCEKFAAITEADMARGVFNQTSVEQVTLRELLQHYLEAVTPGKRGKVEEAGRISTLLKTESAARPMLDKVVASLSGSDVAKWRDKRIKEGAAPATVVREWSILSHCLEVARMEWGHVGMTNPFKAVRKPTIQNARSRRVTPEELDAICTASGSTELALLLRLGVETGARRGELLAIQWRDVNLKTRTARLHDGTTKNGHGRTLPLSPAALKIFSNMVRRIDGGAVFSLRPDSVSQAFRRAVARARKNYEASLAAQGKQPDPCFLVGLKFHDSRHEACSRLAERGFSTLEIASVSGHRTVQLLSRYVHLNPEDLARKLA